MQIDLSATSDYTHCYVISCVLFIFNCFLVASVVLIAEEGLWTKTFYFVDDIDAMQRL